MKTASLLILVLGLLPGVAVSGEIFDFIVDDSSGGQFAFATLELSQLPAQLEHVIHLKLSPQAQEKFGFEGELYGGDFDRLLPPENGPRFVFDFSGNGLTGTDGNGINGITMRDFDAIPSSNLLGLVTVKLFDVTASSIRQLRDEFLMEYVDRNGNEVLVIQTGDFIQVPEPAANALGVLGFGTYCLLTRRRSRKRRR